MKKEGLQYFSDTHLTIAGLFIFLICFLAIVLWTYRKSAKAHYGKVARLPLEEVKNER